MKILRWIFGLWAITLTISLVLFISAVYMAMEIPFGAFFSALLVGSFVACEWVVITLGRDKLTLKQWWQNRPWKNKKP
jgi:hypothetical protein